MYVLVLAAHGWIRWIVLFSGLALAALAWQGWRRQTRPSPGHDRLRRAFLVALGIQVALGLLLYGFLSPTVAAARADMGAALGVTPLRFYSVEHPFGMLVAALIAYVGLARAGRLEGAARHRVTFFAVALWLLITLVSIPWPGLPYGRPLFRVGL